MSVNILEITDKDIEALKLVMEPEAIIALRANKAVDFEISEELTEAAKRVEKLIKKSGSIGYNATLYKVFSGEGADSFKKGGSLIDHSFLIAVKKRPEVKKGEVLISIQVPPKTSAFRLPGQVFIFNRGIELTLKEQLDPKKLIRAEFRDNRSITMVSENESQIESESYEPEKIETIGFINLSDNVTEFHNSDPDSPDPDSPDPDSTGQITKFHNPWRDDRGRFDHGPDGPGRLREIRNPKEREKAEEKAKKLIKTGKVVSEPTTEKTVQEQAQDLKDSATNRKKSLAAEDQLEKLRDQAFERNEKAEAENDKKALKESNQELLELQLTLRHVRQDAYDKDVQDEINAYDDQVISSRILKSDSKFGDRQSQDILGGGEAWANDEKAKLQAEARGKKLPEVRQTVGQKEGDWPDPAGIAPGVEGRKVEQIARGGIIRTVEVDGIDVKSAYEVTASDGTKIRVYDMASRNQKPHVTAIANSAAYMHELYPNDPAKSVIMVSDSHMRSLAGGRAVFAGVFPGSQHVYVNTSLAGPQTRIERAVADRQWNRIVESGWMMPASKHTSKNHYVMVHEWGHQYDFTNRRSAAKAMYQTPEVRKHLSTYGRTEPKEGYAEAFAEWHVSQGQTKNPAARAYAKYEKWHGHDRASGTRTEAKATGPRVGGQDRRIVRTPEGADRFGVPIGAPIPEDDETSTLDPVQLTSREADLELAINLGIIRPITTRGETMVQFQKDNEKDSGDESKKDEDSGAGNEEKVTLPSEELIKKVPRIFDYFDGKNHADVKNFPKESKASEINRKEAEKIARKAFDELGVEFK